MSKINYGSPHTTTHSTRKTKTKIKSGAITTTAEWRREINNIQHMQKGRQDDDDGGDKRKSWSGDGEAMEMKRKRRRRGSGDGAQQKVQKLGVCAAAAKKPVHKLSIIKMQNFPYAHIHVYVHTNKQHVHMYVCIEKRVEEATCRKSKTLDSPESQKKTRRTTTTAAIAAITSGETNGINDRWNARGERVYACVCASVGPASKGEQAASNIIPLALVWNRDSKWVWARLGLLCSWAAACRSNRNITPNENSTAPKQQQMLPNRLNGCEWEHQPTTHTHGNNKHFKSQWRLWN